ncbi:formylglycine-generating enzyme family protein [Streptomyces zingiberis]|uniref:Formylglycine-generating enzyme family protein n=1 Tax=Streptomyces zingiberis TaxID=2053010 RepID=A0ABX1BY42_9ACTN|nr:SUMF1/EgtB/PvdO family nonheme iron enzyme [Streptomyces zingiberis]NJQ00417.1 formylglycine-generating enzyme family protein [Streptomyces zingiberis]
MTPTTPPPRRPPRPDRTARPAPAPSAHGSLPAFAGIPPGTLPGSPPAAAPARTEGFRLATTPTTVGQYWYYLLDQGLHRAPAPRLHAFPAGGGTGLRTEPSGAVVPDADLSGLPVTGVTWYGARAYCAWLGRRTDAVCRLPSAAEWHYAAAGPENRRWALGDTFDRALYAPPRTSPRPTAGVPPNPYGLRGMTGDVFEWCADPRPGDPCGPGGSRALKGGAYTVRNPESFENATVFTADALSCLPYIGFRVLAVTPPAPRPAPP